MKKITYIKIKKLVPSRWGTGIRDQEKYYRLKENIAEQGLNDPLNVFPIDGGLYEPYAGDHRLRAIKELKEEDSWIHDSIPCIISDISVEEAFERCFADNSCRADLDSLEKENKIAKALDSGRYKSNAQLGKKIGMTGQRVGQLIDSKKIRDECIAHKSKRAFMVSDETLRALKPLKNKNHRARLVDLVANGNIHVKDTKKVAELCQNDLDTCKKILIDGVSYYQILKQHQQDISKAVKRKKTKTYPISDPNLPQTIYQNTSNNLNKHFYITTDERTRRQSIDYLKMTISLMAKKLSDEKAITKEQFEQIKDDILGVYRDRLDDYEGESLNKNNLGKWTGN